MSEPLLGAGRVRELMKESGIRPTKSLGQNFVVDPNTIRKVVDAARVTGDDHVLEIGAGLGSLTLGLAARARHVTALEVDERLLEALQSAVRRAENVEIVHADATQFDYGSCSATQLVGNLPYNIAAQIVVRALQLGATLRSLTVMTQREVGERLAAPPGSKVYGLTSVLVAYHGRAQTVGRVSRNAFYPIPNVDSVIVRIERDPSPRAVAWDALASVARAAFAQRRKTLRGALSAYAGSGSRAEELLRRAGVEPGERAERLDLDAFLRIAAARADDDG